MDEPICTDKKPVVLELEPGSYWWCQCGKSTNQPWCDGSHRGTGLAPVEVTVTEKKRYAMCLCKRTGNAPYCDGTHKQL